MVADDRKNTIVIVDDDDDLLKLLVVVFKMQGFNVEGLSNGKAALEYLSKEENIKSTCLIILDRMLGDMDGLEILMKINEKFKLTIPVLILSVLSAEKDIIEGLKKGAIDYIAKPFSVSVLLEQAKSLISKGK